MGNLIFMFLLLSLLAFIVLGVLLVIRLILKKGMATKKILMFMGTSFVVFLLSFFTLPSFENGSSEANKPNVEESDESVEASASNDEDEDKESEAEDKEDESIDDEKSDDKQAEGENVEKKNKKETDQQEDDTQNKEAKENDDSEVYLNVYEAAEKGLDEVNQLLGEGEKIDEGEFNSFGVSYPTETYVYDDSIEVLFIDGVAARITLTPKEEISFNDEDAREAFLRQYGFPFWSSSGETERAILWESVGSIADGLYQVTMFNDGEGNINYVYVIADQKYQ